MLEDEKGVERRRKTQIIIKIETTDDHTQAQLQLPFAGATETRTERLRRVNQAGGGRTQCTEWLY